MPLCDPFSSYARIHLVPNFIDTKEADWMFEMLLQEIPWRQRTHIRQGNCVAYLTVFLFNCLLFFCCDKQTLNSPYLDSKLSLFSLGYSAHAFAALTLIVWSWCCLQQHLPHIVMYVLGGRKKGSSVIQLGYPFPTPVGSRLSHYRSWTN